jgi:alkaline phosphatase
MKKQLFVCGFSLWWMFGLSAQEPTSVVFLHPDGAGLGHWYAGRLMGVGPDGQLNWDKLERAAVYRSHQKGWLGTTSHAGATVHAYGKKVHPDSYGLDRDQPLQSASGTPLSVMQEAIQRGIPAGIVNSGHIGEPGTGVFLASSASRRDVPGIAAQLVVSGAQVMFCGGEIYMLPKGEMGRHGREGVREDGRNLLKEAEALGYTVIFTREELLALDPGAGKVMGVFAAKNTYNDATEAQLRSRDLPWYDPEAPTFAEMTSKAMELLSRDADTPFLLVAEEEGTDNFANYTNAGGMIEAVRRADAGIGSVLSFMEENPDRKVLMILAADSDAGNPSVWAPYELPQEKPLPLVTDTGASLDGVGGAQTLPFVSAPDANGHRHAFGIAWPFAFDMQGAVVAKAHGHGSEFLPVDLDNTGIYTLMRNALFGESILPAEAE